MSLYADSSGEKMLVITVSVTGRNALADVTNGEAVAAGCTPMVVKVTCRPRSLFV